MNKFLGLLLRYLNKKLEVLWLLYCYVMRNKPDIVLHSLDMEKVIKMTSRGVLEYMYTIAPNAFTFPIDLTHFVTVWNEGNIGMNTPGHQAIIQVIQRNCDWRAAAQVALTQAQPMAMDALLIREMMEVTRSMDFEEQTMSCHTRTMAVGQLSMMEEHSLGEHPCSLKQPTIPCTECHHLHCLLVLRHGSLWFSGTVSRPKVCMLTYLICQLITRGGEKTKLSAAS